METKDYFTIGIAAFSLILGIINLYGNQFSMKNEFYKWAISKEMVDARHKVRTSDNLTMHDEGIPELINFFNYWGLMVKQHHLPLSTFNSGFGISAVEMYRGVLNLIEEERKTRNKLYARDFEWLYDKIVEKYPEFVPKKSE